MSRHTIKQLDQIDILIINELQKNARKSFTDIAKVLNVSLQDVSYRFKVLVKEGVIKGSTLILDFNKISLYSKYVYLTTSCGKEKDVVNYINNQISLPLKDHTPLDPESFVFPNFVFEGASSVWGIIYGVNKEEVEKVVTRIGEHPDVLKILTALVVGFDLFPENVQFNGSQKKLLGKGSLNCYSDFNLDDLDLQILEYLIDDAMLSFCNIAKRLRISSDTVARRYDKMLKSGLIMRASIILNFADYGFCGDVAYRVALKDRSLVNSVKSRLLEIPNNYAVLTLDMGDFPHYSLDVAYLVKDVLDIVAIEEVISLIQGVKRVNHVIFTTPKCSFELPVAGLSKLLLRAIGRYAACRMDPVRGSQMTG
jgi:Lrp/AsnC family transcriptional regulator for asnA, asnC and gidA